MPIHTFLRRLACFRHDYLIAADADMMFLRCRNCGRRTAGWTLGTEVYEEADAPRRSLKDAALARVAGYRIARGQTLG